MGVRHSNIIERTRHCGREDFPGPRSCWICIIRLQQLDVVIRPCDNLVFVGELTVKHSSRNLSVEALDARVLRRLSRLNVYQLDLSLHAPRQKMPAGQLRPVVAANCLSTSKAKHSLVYASTTPSTRIARPHSTASLHRVVHKIQRPLLVGRQVRPAA